MKNKIALIIPTKDRPRELEKLLNSIRVQTCKQDQLVIVDGGKQKVNNLLGKYEELNIDYISVDSPGLAKQKNEGLKKLKGGITLVGYLDDDIVLESDTLEQMLLFWEYSEDGLGGASFNIVNNRKPCTNWYTKFFMLSGPKGTLLRSGVNVIYSPVLENVYVEWLCGGATVWRRSVLEKYRFDEWLAGYGHNDDVEYSARLGGRYRLAIVVNAKVRHFQKPLDISQSFSFGKSGIINRYYVVTKYPYFSKACFYWATFGQILAGLLRGIFLGKGNILRRTLGYISALFSIWSGKLERIDLNIA